MAILKHTFTFPPEIYPEPITTTFKYDPTQDVEAWSAGFKEQLKDQIIIKIVRYYKTCGVHIQFITPFQYFKARGVPNTIIHQFDIQTLPEYHLYVTPTTITIPQSLKNPTVYNKLKTSSTQSIAAIITALLFKHTTLIGMIDIQHPADIHKDIIEKSIHIANDLHEQIKDLHLDILESAHNHRQLELQNKLNNMVR